ncbi:hypothetical protein OU5_1059 [Pseudomonas mandelii JR-1]|uniref:Uncharacterized protein n=1 Tax=Pseudomonas mandelii JR-1 TaxID=1147786 RepID=A0A024E729_9PSED|nr:hypothetical protein OU5_1059 [Pseudomonas mandelii JR-1]
MAGTNKGRMDVILKIKSPVHRVTGQHHGLCSMGAIFR